MTLKTLRAELKEIDKSITISSSLGGEGLTVRTKYNRPQVLNLLNARGYAKFNEEIDGPSYDTTHVLTFTKA